jgi:hypothetical protein
MDETKPVYYYRYIEYGSANSEGEPLSFASVSLVLEILELVKKTPCGVWLNYGYTGAKNKFVLDYATKKYAHSTKEKAYESFLARKQKQLKIYKQKVRTIEIVMAINKDEAHITAPSSYWKR